MNSELLIYLLFSACCMILVPGLMLLWVTGREIKRTRKFTEPECKGCSWKGNHVDFDGN